MAHHLQRSRTCRFRSSERIVLEPIELREEINELIQKMSHFYGDME